MFKVALIGIALAAFFWEAQSLSLCLRNCNEEKLKLICATNGKTTKLFSSECEVKNAECTDQVSYNQVQLGTCLAFTDIIYPIEEIPEHPIYIYPMEPLTARSTGEVLHPLCQFVCAKTYNPVCGFDGEDYETFENYCLMSWRNCAGTQKFTRVEPEKCNITA